MENALTATANLPETVEEVERFVKKAIDEVKQGHYDKMALKKKLHFSTIAFRKIINSIG